ncbi:unnamed protein product, partial [Ectocarpus sp. 12 AP-2014]
LLRPGTEKTFALAVVAWTKTRCHPSGTETRLTGMFTRFRRPGSNAIFSSTFGDEENIQAEDIDAKTPLSGRKRDLHDKTVAP